MTKLPYLDADAVTSALEWPEAIRAIAAAVTGLDPVTVTDRTIVPVTHGELMLMPAQSETATGVKVLSIAPANPARGLPRIQALYVLFDSQTLTPRALLDGSALTTVRTPAVSAFAALALARIDAATMTVFGSGPQAEAHVHSIRSIRPVRTVVVVGRDAGRAQALVARLIDSGLDARVGAADSVRAADIVVCATTAREPLFDGSTLAPHACVIAIGSHVADAREVDDATFRRADRIVVEAGPTALREAGDVIRAIASGALRPEQLLDIQMTTSLRPGAGISVFKSVGMGWQDLAIAEAVIAQTEKSGGGGDHPSGRHG